MAIFYFLVYRHNVINYVHRLKTFTEKFGKFFNKTVEERRTECATDHRSESQSDYKSVLFRLSVFLLPVSYMNQYVT